MGGIPEDKPYHMMPFRSLSKIRLIYSGCAGFGQIFRSFSLNSPNYSPQTIEKSDSNQHPLATIANLGQAPRLSTIPAFSLSLFHPDPNLLRIALGLRRKDNLPL